MQDKEYDEYVAILEEENAELLAALEAIANEPCDHGPRPFCPRELARAAIAKAKGE